MEDRALVATAVVLNVIVLQARCEKMQEMHIPREKFLLEGMKISSKRLIQTFLADFQVALTSVANIFDPDCILLGGAVSKGVSAYFTQIETWMKEHAFPAVASHTRLGIAKHGNLSGALGAALLMNAVSE